jgi:exocyst complex component 2
VQVHKNTSFRDLQSGYLRLQDTVEKRKETMKSLVKDNFDRFVGAKSTVEAIYKELKSKNLNSAGYGTENFCKELQDSNELANQIFKPIVERKMKAEKIRSTLTILERYKFFFNLPSSLQEAIEKHGKFDQAVHDYKKGRAIYFSHVLTADTPMSPVQAANTGRGSRKAAAPNGLVKVFEKVWQEVERVIVGLRQRLFRELADMTLSFELQERNMIALIELDSPEDPVWFYIQAQCKWIMGLIQEEQVDFQAKLEDVISLYFEKMDELQRQRYLHQTEAAAKTDEQLKEVKIQLRQQYLDSIRFRRSIQAVVTNEYELMFSRDLEVRGWMLHLQYAKSVTEIVKSCLPDFSKLCRTYVDGKFHAKADGTMDGRKGKKEPVDSKKADECQRMMTDILDKLQHQVMGNFEFISKCGLTSASQDAISGSSGKSKPQVDPPKLTSTHSIYLGNLRDNTIATSYYLPQIALEFAHCVSESTKIGRASMNPLNHMLDRIKKEFIDMICAGWLRGGSYTRYNSYY